MCVRQTGIAKPAGKTQAVHQSEQESHDPRRTGGDAYVAVPAAQNLCGDENDAQRDHCLDRPLRNVDVAERRDSA